MIHRIYSSLPSFKEQVFGTGLNILVADKTAESSAQQTRNRAGKTSLVEIIHYLTGASAGEKSIFRNEVLVEHTFGMEFNVGRATVSVERTGTSYLNVSITLLDGDTSAWPTNPFNDGERAILRNSEWLDILGEVIFDLHKTDSSRLEKFRPKFRALFAYFVRRQASQGFTEATKQAAQQSTWDRQVMISYLLGLDWTISQEFQYVREREKSLRELKRSAAGGELSAILGTTAELRTAVALSEERVARLRDAVGSFRVLPTYREREIEANLLTQDIRDQRNENQRDRSLVLELQRALASEEPPQVVELERLYFNAGVQLPGVALRRFEQVRAFHESVISNRRMYLAGELEAAQGRVMERERRMAIADQRRREIFELLQSHGALEQLISLQLELARAAGETESLRQRFAAAEQLEGASTQVGIERRQLLLRLQQNHREQSEMLRLAIIAIEEITGSLYEQPGRFVVDETTGGPMYDIKLEGDRSTGIGHMEIFSFDMMLMRVTLKRSINPGFLVHDSHLFDGVDGRQIGKALQVGAQMASDLKFQYIVTMNTDDIPNSSELPEKFEVAPFILPARLTDATEDGGLFGIRFD